MLDSFHPIEQFADERAAFLSLGPSPAPGQIPSKRAVKQPRPMHVVPDYLCPQPIRSSSPAVLSAVPKRKMRPGVPEEMQRQASEEISSILGLRTKNPKGEPPQDKLFLDGSRSADMFTRKPRSNRLPHYATPPVGMEREDSSSDSDTQLDGFQSPVDDSAEGSELHGLQYALRQSPGPLRSASIYDLPVMADSTFSPPTRSQNPLPRNSPFAVQLDYSREGAEIGLLSFSPPSASIDEDLRARRARFVSSTNLASDFRNKIRFGDVTPRGQPSTAH